MSQIYIEQITPNSRRSLEWFVFVKSSGAEVATQSTNVGSENIPDVTIHEIRSAFKKMKNNKYSGGDHITADKFKIWRSRVEKTYDLREQMLARRRNTHRMV